MYISLSSVHLVLYNIVVFAHLTPCTAQNVLLRVRCTLIFSAQNVHLRVRLQCTKTVMYSTNVCLRVRCTKTAICSTKRTPESEMYKDCIFSTKFALESEMCKNCFFFVRLRVICTKIGLYSTKCKLESEMYIFSVQNLHLRVRRTKTALYQVYILCCIGQFLCISLSDIHFVLKKRSFCTSHSQVYISFCAVYGSFFVNLTLRCTLCAVYGRSCTSHSQAYILCRGRFCTSNSQAYSLCCANSHFSTGKRPGNESTTALYYCDNHGTDYRVAHLC